MLSLLVNRDLNMLAKRTDLNYWKELLAIFCTYAKNFPELCDIVGDRLLNEEKDTSRALLFYICAGSISKAISIWNEKEDSNTVIEKVFVWNNITKENEKISQPSIVNLYVRHAESLSARGKLEEALKCLENILEPNDSIRDLVDRIKKSLGITPISGGGDKKELPKEPRSTHQFNTPPKNTEPRKTTPPVKNRGVNRGIYTPPSPKGQPQIPITPPETVTINQQLPRTFNTGGIITPQYNTGGIINPQPIQTGTINPNLPHGKTNKKEKEEEVPPTPPPKGLSVPKSKKKTKLDKENQNQ